MATTQPLAKHAKRRIVVLRDVILLLGLYIQIANPSI
jgi:histone H3/H4